MVGKRSVAGHPPLTVNFFLDLGATAASLFSRRQAGMCDSRDFPVTLCLMDGLGVSCRVWAEEVHAEEGGDRNGWLLRYRRMAGTAPSPTTVVCPMDNGLMPFTLSISPAPRLCSSAVQSQRCLVSPCALAPLSSVHTPPARLPVCSLGCPVHTVPVLSPYFAVRVTVVSVSVCCLVHVLVCGCQWRCVCSADLARCRLPVKAPQPSPPPHHPQPPLEAVAVIPSPQLARTARITRTTRMTAGNEYSNSSQKRQRPRVLLLR